MCSSSTRVFLAPCLSFSALPHSHCLSVCLCLHCLRNCPNIAATHGCRVQGITGGRGIVLLAIIELNSKIWAIDLQAFAIRGDTTIKLTMAKHTRFCRGKKRPRERGRGIIMGECYGITWNGNASNGARKLITSPERDTTRGREATVCEVRSSSKWSRVSLTATATICWAALALGLRQLQLQWEHLKATVTTVSGNCKCTRWTQLQLVDWLT